MSDATGVHATLADFDETGLALDEAIWREAEWGEMRVGYETYLQDFDDAPLLKGLPNDRCQCPHWGYLLSGRMTVLYADHEEVVEAGEIYYMAPDHTIEIDAGTVLIEFSPKDEFRKTAEVGERNLAELEDKQRETER
ncbi:cupin domain-containing protein [halophilic archaeon]|nr:cupin domain-containing protein [halophilic archaeon]